MFLNESYPSFKPARCRPVWVMFFLLMVCGGNQSAPSPSRTVRKTLSFTSDAQDFVGQGQSRTFTLQNAVFQPLVARSGGYLSVVIRPNDSSLPWGLIVTAPTGQRLMPGSYDTTRFETATTVGLDFS